VLRLPLKFDQSGLLIKGCLNSAFCHHRGDHLLSLQRLYAQKLSELLKGDVLVEFGDDFDVVLKKGFLQNCVSFI
jgi:hypothetical protein